MDNLDWVETIFDRTLHRVRRGRSRRLMVVVSRPAMGVENKQNTRSHEWQNALYRRRPATNDGSRYVFCSSIGPSNNLRQSLDSSALETLVCCWLTDRLQSIASLVIYHPYNTTWSSSKPYPTFPPAPMSEHHPETFSTPPSTPAAWTILKGTDSQSEIYPTLSKKSSRPSSLHIERSQAEYKSNIELVDSASPPPTDRNPSAINGTPFALKPSSMAQDIAALKKTPTAHAHPAVESPCFVHSHLDKSAGLTNWFKQKQDGSNGDHTVGKLFHDPSQISPGGSVASSLASSSVYDIEEDDYTSSLTTRLAETAVGVREMSKQLGGCPPRARVSHSHP